MNDPIDFQIPTSPVLPVDCPISTLLGKRVVDMTDEELEQYTKEMRTAVESPQSLRKLISGGATKSKKKTSTPAKIDLSLLGI